MPRFYRGKVAMVHAHGSCLPVTPHRSGPCSVTAVRFERRVFVLDDEYSPASAFRRATLDQLNTSCRAVSQIATTAGCFSFRFTEIALPRLPTTRELSRGHTQWAPAFFGEIKTQAGSCSRF